MTFLEAATYTLIQNGNQPMSSNEIWDYIKQNNLYKTNGKTPWASLSTILLKHSDNSKVNGKYKEIILTIVSKNPIKYILINFNTPTNLIEDTEDIEEELTVLTEKVLLYQITSKELGWKKLSVYNNNENIEYEISDCEEYTYIMEDKAHATIKIGKTKNDPELRLNQLKTGNPSISLLHIFPSSQYCESELHEKFNDFQKDLEWFFYTKGLKNFMNDELKKYKYIISSYNMKMELDKIEKEMLENISF